jgi:hypothetical protein
MPITLAPVSRRRFLAGSLAAAGSLALGGRLRAAEEAADPDRFALFSDTHIAGDRQAVLRGTNMFANLQQACREVQQLAPRPSAVFVDGDLALTTGQSEDYVTLVESLAPLRKHGLPIHLALGNHDHRQRFWAALPPEDATRAVDERHISVISSRLANWFVLDSLDETNKTPGVLGEAQLAWLAAALDKQADKPALVVVHHNPDDRPKPGGLVETKALLDLLAARRHVKALIFGHTHDWKIAQHEGIHLVNLPPVAYTFAAGKPNGWVDCQLQESGAKLTLQCFDPAHAQHRQVVDLAWR